MMKFTTNLFAQLGDFGLDLLFPKFCVNYGACGNHMCLECYQTIENSITRTCFYCGRISSGGKVCVQCTSKHKQQFRQLVWAGSYKNEALKSMIHGLKYGKLLYLAEIMAEMLAQSLSASGVPLDVVTVPVPLFWEKEKKREFNQSELIVRHLSKRLNLHGGMALRRIKETKSQVGLDREKRIENVENAFKCVDKRMIKGKVVLLVDDVATTGSTLNECAKALITAGAKKVIAAVVARG